MQNLRTAQMDLHKLTKQASEIVALKEQMAAKEFGWDQEKQKILKALKSERELKKELREELKATKDVLGKEKQHESSKRENYEKKDFEAKLKTQQEDLEKVRQTVLDLKSYAAQKDSELIRSEAEWKIKLTALEDQMRSDLATKEESFQREKVLQRQSRAMAVEWRKLKEEIKLLTQQNADLQVHNLSLQELAQQTGEEKAQFEQEEKKVRQTVLDLESYAAQKDSELIHSEAEWKIKLTALEDQMRSEFAAKEESFQNELQRQSREMEEWRNQKEEINFLTQQNADLQVHNLHLQELAQQTEEEKAQLEQEEKKVRQTVLDLESYAAQKDSELIHSEAEWKIKLTAQEDQMRSELAAKEESFQREKELQRQSRELEEWRCNQKEELKLLTQQNTDLHVHNLHLQELAQLTDKEKAQFKKEEKKARKEAEKTLKKDRKEAEKTLKKDRKEEEKREKKEKKENEKREKEELKTQKKERKENEKRQKKEELENKEKGRK